MSESKNHAKNMATSSTRSKNNSIIYYPHGPLLNGEWTFLALSHPTRDK